MEIQDENAAPKDGICLFAHEKHTKGSGTTVAGNGAAGSCPIGVFEGVGLCNGISNSLFAFFVDRRVGYKQRFMCNIIRFAIRSLTYIAKDFA